ncbi:basic proline-rich protein-like [Passer montanus]|uniref:basic proline-rich protein-like n=1 Tax=Passer montanus TaxID=9160 RepID=UPI00195FF3B0|nr:basic proline-rich protein-like [Passer montanus]
MALGRKAKGGLRPAFTRTACVTSAAPPGAAAGAGVRLSHPRAGTAAPGPLPPSSRAQRCPCQPQPPPPRRCRCPPRPPPPRSRQAQCHSPGNGQSTRDGGGLGTQVVQRYLIYPAGRRAALSPHKARNNELGPLDKAPRQPKGHRLQSRWRSPRAPLARPSGSPAGGAQVPVTGQPPHLPAPSSTRDRVCARGRAETVRNNHQGAQLHIPRAFPQLQAPWPGLCPPAPNTGQGSLAREQQEWAGRGAAARPAAALHHTTHCQHHDTLTFP